LELADATLAVVLVFVQHFEEIATFAMDHMAAGRIA
jgi:hypothetical protein